MNSAADNSEATADEFLCSERKEKVNSAEQGREDRETGDCDENAAFSGEHNLDRRGLKY
jgi:hypothetical protein